MPQESDNSSETTSAKETGQNNTTSEFTDEWLATIPEVEDTI